MTNVPEAFFTHRKPLIMKEKKVIYGFQLIDYCATGCVLKKSICIQFERVPGINSQSG